MMEVLAEMFINKNQTVSRNASALILHLKTLLETLKLQVRFISQQHSTKNNIQAMVLSKLECDIMVTPQGTVMSGQI